MDYRLCRQHGDSLAVPQLVFARLSSARENYIRVALYLLASGSTEPRDIAHALNIPQRSAEDALKWWAGAGLLEEVRTQAPLPLAVSPALLTQAQVNEAALRDPLVATLTSEAQQHLGKALGQKDLQLLVSLYLQDGYAVEVILLCCAYLATQEKRTVGAVSRELHNWQLAGVVTGEDAENYLTLLELRLRREKSVTEQLGFPLSDLRQADKQMIRRWYEELHFDDAMVAEAILQADGKKEVRYLNGILKGWHGRGYRTVQEVRGSGALQGSNLRVDREAPSGNDYLQRGARRPLRLKRED